ncbi:MAG: hypothetical protein RI897_1220 [Verrucomicrobiota bacterium]|jgi:hypothetical protein
MKKQDFTRRRPSHSVSFKAWTSTPLLLLLLAGTRLSAADAPTPAIQFEEQNFDFGRVKAGDVVDHRFEFKNSGSAPLEITKVTTACGCTAPGEWDKLVQPGQTGGIPIKFYSGSFSGDVKKSITVLSNDPQNPNITLSIQADVWSPIEITPRSLVFQYDPGAAEGEEKEIVIVNNRDEPLKLSPPEWTQKAFNATLTEKVPGKEFSLKIATVPPVGTGTITAPITLKTSVPDQPRISVHAMAIEKQPYVVVPNRIVLPTEPLAKSTPSPVTLRSLGEKPLQLSEPSSSSPEVRVTVEEIEAGKVFRITPVFPEGFHLQKGQKVTLRIKTSHPTRQWVEIPVLPQVPGRPIQVITPKE